jgi:Ca2+-dependent lipid-binding protein
MPTITISDFDTAPSPKPATKPNGPASTAPALAANGAPLKQPEASTSPNAQPMPGTIPTGEAPAIPDWYRVGWRAVSGFDRPLAEGEEKDRTIIEQFVSDSYYGQFYHNAGIIFFVRPFLLPLYTQTFLTHLHFGTIQAVAASHYMTLFRLGWGWLFILLALCGTYYSTSITRVRRRARDDIQRELVKRRLASEHESAEWINQFLDRFWLIYEPVLSATIVASVDQVLSTQTPPFLDSIRLSTFTLGTKAPRIDKVRTFPSTPEDVVMMDWGFSFTPSDLSDVTPKQAKNRVNPKIVLDIRVGKGITAGMPILLEDMNFSGLMRVKLKLMANFPHVQVCSPRQVL